MDDFIRVATTGGNTRDILREVLLAMPHSDDASITSRPQPSLTKVVMAAVESSAASGLIVAETKTVTICMHALPKREG